MFYVLKKEITEKIAGWDFIRWHDETYYEDKAKANYKLGGLERFFLTLGYWKKEKEFDDMIILHANDNPNKKMTISIETADFS